MDVRCGLLSIVPELKKRVGLAENGGCNSVILEKKPYLRGEGGYYSLDRPPLMDVISVLWYHKKIRHLILGRYCRYR